MKFSGGIRTKSKRNEEDRNNAASVIKKLKITKIVYGIFCGLVILACAFDYGLQKDWFSIDFSDSSHSAPESVDIDNPTLTYEPKDGQSKIFVNVEEMFSMAVDDTKKIPILVAPSLQHEKIEYKVKDFSIASISEDGILTAKKPGETLLTIGCGEHLKIIHFTVTDEIRSLSILSPTKDTRFTVGDVPVPIELGVEPAGMADYIEPKWEIIPEGAAYISEGGLLKPLEGGPFIVKVSYGGKTASEQYFNMSPITEIFMTVEALTLNYGDSVQIPLGANPVKATETLENVQWKSSNEKAVKVSQNGTVTGVGAGKATITATYKDLTASCEINAVVPITSLALPQSEISLKKGNSYTVTASCLPANTTEEKSVLYFTDNAGIAKVSENGKITAVGAGTCHITAAHNDITAVLTVHVYSPMTGIAFDQKDLSVVATTSGTASVSFYPLDTTDAKNVTWASENPAIATVSPNVNSASAVISGNSVGTTAIIARCGVFEARIPITVTPYIFVESVTIPEGNFTFSKIGDTRKITAVISPSNAYDTHVSFYSDDTSIATVSENGVVTAVAPGKTTIHASCGGKTSGISVTVPEPDFCIVLDPGHDSTHAGAQYNDINGVLRQEQVINLTVAKACRDYLLANYKGVSVYLTREDLGCPVPGQNNGSCLSYRAATFPQSVGENGKTYVISLHFNATSSHNASGSLCFIQNPSRPTYSASLGMANSILAEIQKATGLRNQGVSVNTNYLDEYGNPTDYYAICRHSANAGIPGLIVEHCFMDHDNAFTTDDWLVQFGIADAKGIAAYLGLEKKN